MPLQNWLLTACVTDKTDKTAYKILNLQLMPVCKYLLILTVLLSCFCNSQLIAQHFPVLNFKTISEKNGLSSNEVNSIAQDNNGMMWIGTSNGLNRFDGSKIKCFFANTVDSGTLYSNLVTQLVNHKTGDMLVLGPNSLQQLQPGKEVFASINLNLTRPFVFKKADETIVRDDVKGLFRFSDAGLKRLQEPFRPFRQWGVTFKTYLSLCTDRAGNYWGSIANRVFKLDPVSKKSLVEFTLGQDMNIQDMYFDNKGRCWIATWGKGIFLLDLLTGSTRQFPLSVKDIVAFNFNSWTFNGKKYIIVCSDAHYSLILIDEETLAYKSYLSESNTTLVLRSFVDRDNNLWLATNNGAKVVSAAPPLYEIIPIIYKNKNNLPENENSGVYAIKEVSNGFWISKRYNGGIYQYDKNWQLKNFRKNLINPETDRYRKISATTEAFDFMPLHNKVYISTESGLVVMDTASGKTTLLYPDDDSLHPRLRNFSVKNDSLWWIRSFRKGIYLFNNQQNRFKKLYSLRSTAGDYLNANYVLQTAKKQVYASSFEGLFRLNEIKDDFEKLNPGNLPSPVITGMAEDKNGLLWLCTQNGLAAYNPSTGKLSRTFPEYAEMGSCTRVAIDPFNNVWFNCQQGYWCWVQQQQRMIKFGYNMGLPDNRAEAGFAAGNNEIVYGGAMDALVKFFPANIIQYSVKARSIITDILADGKRLTAMALNDSTEQVDIAAGSHAVNISFSVTEYSTPDQYRLFYRLDEEKNWILAHNGIIGFNNLAHGNYSIELKGQNPLTGNYSSPYFLNISVLPKWYETWAFKISLLALAAGLIYFFYRMRINAIRKNSLVKQRITETEMQALRAQMNPHFIFNSLNSIENFIMQNEKRLASDYLNKFSRLIRGILDSSKNEMVPFEKDMEVLKLYVELEQLRFNNKFTYSTSIDEELLNKNVRVPTLLLQPYVENAIIHGFSRIKKTGLQLEITAAVKENYIHYTVEDNGAGRAKAAAYNEENRPDHKSVGLQITEERLRHINGNGSSDPVHFTDLYDAEGKPAGTRVEIKLKIT